jgi:hypothetical protein
LIADTFLPGWHSMPVLVRNIVSALNLTLDRSYTVATRVRDAIHGDHAAMLALHFPRHPGLVAGILLTAAILWPSGDAQAQLDDLLKQVLPGTRQDPGQAAAAGEQACERYAEDRGLDVQRVIGTRPSGNNNLEISLSVEDRDERYEALCVYDTGDGTVRELEAVSGTTEAHSRGEDDNDDVDQRTAQRAHDACERLARDQGLDDVFFGSVSARGGDTVEVAMTARQRGKFTCLYDDDQRQALFAD